VFLSIEASAGAAGNASLAVTQDGQPVAEERLSIAEGRVERVALQVASDKASALEARLVPDGFDSLASDNVAHLTLPALRPLWVYASPSLAAYRHALRALPSVRLFPRDGASAPSSYDLVLADNAADLALDAPCTLSVGVVPPRLAPLVAVDDQGSSVVDWRRSDPLLQHVELAELAVLDGVRSAPGVGAADYENLGYDILVHGNRSPLLVTRRAGATRHYHLLFHTARSTLPYRIGFPILVSNLVGIAMDHAGLAKAQAPRTGILPPLTLRPARDYRVRSPDGTTRTERSNTHGVLAGVPAPRVGRYRITEAGAERAVVGASLLSSRETRLVAVEALQFNEDLTVAADKEPPRTDRSLWWPLTLVALAVMLGEWWYYQRRPGGFVR